MILVKMSLLYIPLSACKYVNVFCVIRNFVMMDLKFVYTWVMNNDATYM
jgi:hypothetical protein